jgi:hypothetical protein
VAEKTKVWQGTFLSRTTRPGTTSREFVGSKLDAHLAFLSGACNAVQSSVAADLSALSGDVLEQQAGVKFLGKRLGATRNREGTFLPFEISAKVTCQMREAYTGEKPPCTEPAYAQYMVVPCPEYQPFPELEHDEFFQNTLNNVFAIFQLSKL